MLLEMVADELDPPVDPYMSDPVGWIKDRIHEETWSAQREILESIRDNRYTAVPSCHGAGKSHIASRAVAWWIDSHPINDVFVVTTAPSTNQVKAILWRYIKNVHRENVLDGYITGADTPEWKMEGDRLVAWGRKPQDLNNAEEAATAFQGIHAKYVLVVLDEAGGIPEWLWNAVDSLVTDPRNRVLAIGNPDDPTSKFEEICRPGTTWNVIQISAFDMPCFTGEEVSEELAERLDISEWVEERKKVWGEESPLYVSKVLAKFPDRSDDSLFPISWVRRAMELDLSGEAIDLGKAALDVARQGADESILGWNRGGMFRIVKHKIGIGDTMKLVGWLSNFNEDHPAVPIIIDADGVGGPVYDRALELRLPVSPFHGGQKAFKPRKFKNRRSEQLWALRGLFEDGLIDIDPADDQLQSQLVSIKFTEDSAGRITVETKKELKKRGLPSPDRLDTLFMSTAPATDFSGIWDKKIGEEDSTKTETSDLLEAKW